MEFEAIEENLPMSLSMGHLSGKVVARQLTNFASTSGSHF